jgi:hypothetical protein
MTEVRKRRKARLWTEEKKGLFLDALAATCCVRRAAEAADMAPTHCYALKLRDAEFAARWQEAIAIGYAQVEERLILDALGQAANDEEGTAALVRMDKYEREQALNLLKYHREEAIVRPHRGGTPEKCAAQDETDAAILARLAAVRKRLGR